MIFEENSGSRLEKSEDMLTCLERVKTYIASHIQKQSSKDVKRFASSNSLVSDKKTSDNK